MHFLKKGLENMNKGRSPIMAQMEKIFRHTRVNSFGTRARYENSCRKFIEFLEEQFKMKNLKNLQDKHLVSYIKYRQTKGIASKTLKNDLGAIRYMHDMIPNVKFELSDNKELKDSFSVSLEKTPAIKGNRAWTHQEFEAMLKLAKELVVSGGDGFRTANDVQDTMILGRTMGLRVTEAIAMSRSQAEEALRTGIYQVKGEAKNGKWRQVPLSKEARKVLDKRLQVVKRGGRLFIRENEKTHEAVNRVEKFLYNHRNKVETKEGGKMRTWVKDGEFHTNELTFHGLRYGYVQDRVQEEMAKGFNLEQAAAIVTKEVGHERTDVIKIYLGGCDRRNTDGLT
jgi:integrase/recombinase XerD